MSTDGIACTANVFVSIEHDGTTYRFKWHATNGWFAVNKDGLEISARVPPDSVWDQLTRMKPVDRKTITVEGEVEVFADDIFLSVEASLRDLRCHPINGVDLAAGIYKCLAAIPKEVIAAMSVGYRRTLLDVLIEQLKRYKEPRS